MRHTESQDLSNVADAINRYLASHPDATETVEGVARWWLTRQRYNDSVEVVQGALDLLESQGEVVKVSLAGGAVIYRKAPPSAPSADCEAPRRKASVTGQAQRGQAKRTRPSRRARTRA